MPSISAKRGIVKEWREGGVLHREDGPAIIYKEGSEEWYRHGKRHREGGPAIIDKDGYLGWFNNGLAHREDGPSHMWEKGDRVWHRHGKLHREDGPAIIYKDGTEAWWVTDTELTKKDTETAKKVLSGKYPFENLPLLINHPILKYFAKRKLGDHGT